MRTFTRFLLVMTLAMAGTWILGWWAVPIAGFIGGIRQTRGAVAAAACATAWLLILLDDVFLAGFWRLGGTLTGIMGLPLPALIALTLLFPAVLGWSAASLGDAARSLIPTSRQPS